MDVKKAILIRSYILGALVVLLGFCVIGKVLYIQLAEGKKWVDKGSKLYYKYNPVEADRGNIYDKDGDVIVGTIPKYEIRVDINADPITDEVFSNNLDSLAISLSKFSKGFYSVGYYKRVLIGARKNNDRFVLLFKNVTIDRLKKVKSFPIFRRGRFKGGLIVKKEYERIKPFGAAAYRTIGYANSGGQIGLEGYYNSVLEGEKGVRLEKRISSSVWAPVNNIAEIKPVSGDDIVTTLDMKLQDVTHRSLKKSLVRHGANHGCAIVMEVATGKIRAITNLGLTRDSTYAEQYNYAIGESSEPGSTMKLGIMLALLEQGDLNLDDTVYINKGKYKFYDRTMEDSHVWEQDYITIREAFEASSNVGMARLTQRHFGNKLEHKLIGHLKSAGLLDTTGVDIRGEVEPYFKKPGEPGWYGTTLPWMSIGYECKLTPLQMLNFYNAVANGGKMMKPSLVEGVASFGKVTKRFEPTVVNPAIASKATIAKLHDLLIGVVEDGTANRIKSDLYAIAGKTGTSLINYNRVSDSVRVREKQYQASFAGFFPADNPKYSVIVVVNDPVKNGFYGGQCAAPVFKDIADYFYSINYMGYPSVNEELYTNKTDDLPNNVKGYYTDLNYLSDYLGLRYVSNSMGWSKGTVADDTLVYSSVNFMGNEVPDVSGMGARDAVHLLENLGLKVELEGIGKVVEQSLIPGSKIDNSSIKIKLG